MHFNVSEAVRLLAQVRAPMPQLDPRKIMTVQPLTGPTGLIYYLKYRYMTNTHKMVETIRKIINNLNGGVIAVDNSPAVLTMRTILAELRQNKFRNQLDEIKKGP